MVVKTAVGYCRVSTNGQEENGLSLESQKQKIRQYAKMKNLDLGKIFEDVKTGANLNRPGAQELMRLCRGGYFSDIIIVSLDRLSRNVIDTWKLIKEIFEPNEVHFHCILQNIDTGTPIGRFFVSITAAFAEMEREMISQRTKQALQYCKLNGKAYGQTPYGYKKVKKTLIVDPDEKSTIRRIKALRRHLSLNKIADRLNEGSSLSKNGKPWTRFSITAALKA